MRETELRALVRALASAYRRDTGRDLPPDLAAQVALAARAAGRPKGAQPQTVKKGLRAALVLHALRRRGLTGIKAAVAAGEALGGVDSATVYKRASEHGAHAATLLDAGDCLDLIATQDEVEEVAQALAIARRDT